MIFFYPNTFSNLILIIVRACGGETPTHPSPLLGLLDATDDINAIASSSTGVLVDRNQQENIKKACLKRDNQRCLITGFMDKSAYDKLPPNSMPPVFVRTACAHIIPYSMGAREVDSKKFIRYGIL